jgi:hypothetical protein
MHAPAFTGDCTTALRDLANAYNAHTALVVAATGG